jgi:signal transduction histidine kinase
MKFNPGTILTTASLIILMGFIGFWLKNAYQDEKAAVKTDLYLKFKEASQEVKDSIFKNMFRYADTSFIHSDIGAQDTLINLVVRPTVRTKKIMLADSVKYKKEFFTSNEFKVFITDEGSWSTSDTNVLNIEIEGSKQKKVLDFVSFTEVGGNELSLIEEKFQRRIKDAGLPADYMILETFDSTLIKDGLAIVINKINPVYGQTSIAKFESFRPYLLKRMWPQILFGVFLFSVVAIAFYISGLRFKELKRLSEMKNDFVSNMTHELKTPISTVSVAIEALKSFDALEDRNKTREYLDISKNELNRLTLLVDKVLKMSQFDNNYGQLDKMKEMDFKEIVESVSSSMKLQVEKYNASLFLELEQGDYNLHGDKVHLSNIVYNLIDNALKYGGQKPSIWVNLHDGIDGIILKIRDSGAGINKEYQEKIFDKFFRIPSGNTHNIKGHGLGLSYVAGVIKAHGGKISVNSQENIGSEFIINLPKHV